MEIEEELHRAARDLIASFRQRLDEPIPKAAPGGAYNSPTNASGELDRGLRHEVKTSPNELVLEIYAPPHWRFADRGRPAGGMPPVQRLVDWSLDKGLDFENMQERRSFAFLLGRRIAKQGTLPQHSEFFQRAFPSWSESLPERLAPALAGWLRGEMRAVVEQFQQDPKK